MRSTSEESPDILLDTDIFSEVFKAIDPNVVRHARAYAARHHELLFTSVTVMEAPRGLYRKRAPSQIVKVERVFDRNREIIPGLPDYRLAAEIIGTLEGRGTPIGVSDPLIAACALNRDLGVATGNTRHFGYIVAAGFPLRLEDWRQP